MAKTKEQHRVYMREWTRKNMVRHAGYVAARRQKIRAMIEEIKCRPCADCGGTFPAVCMDFDHLGDKSFTISNSLFVSVKRLQDEIEKCDVVCANCHRIRTVSRGQHKGAAMPCKQRTSGAVPGVSTNINAARPSGPGSL